MLEPTTQVCGGCVILDFDGLSLSHIMQFTPTFAALVLTWVQVGIFCFTTSKIQNNVENVFSIIIINLFVGRTIAPFEICSHCQQFLLIQYAVCYLQAIHPGKATKKSKSHHH